ncbi:camphor resistance protein CrcB, partial [Salmonella enterica subsp. enterica serovar Typhimurium]|nr:camphor resistance protein CrcB [Salmonella enterica subsp. enterica serovar Typhimurium]
MIQALLIMIGGGFGAVVRAWLTDVTKSKWST